MESNKKNISNPIDYSNQDGIAIITLNNPPQNRLTDDLVGDMNDAISDISSRNDTRVLYLKAEGDNFSFGGDITPWTNMESDQISKLLEKTLEVVNRLEDLQIPIVTAIQGNCLGGGFEVALRADFIISSNEAKFGHPEASIGLFTLLGGIQRVADRIGRTRAMQWATTCELIDGNYASEIGLINDSVPSDDLYSVAEEWVEKLAKGPTLAHQGHKKLLRAWSDSGVGAADELMASMAGEIMLSKDAQGSISSAIEALKLGKARPDYPFKGV